MVISSFNPINPPIVDLDRSRHKLSLDRLDITKNRPPSLDFENWQKSRIIMVDIGILKSLVSTKELVDFKNKKDPNEITMDKLSCMRTD